MIDYALARKTKQSGVAFFYCSGNAPLTQHYRSILGSLILQLVKQCKEAIEDLEAICLPKTSGGDTPLLTLSEAAMAQLLQEISKRFDEVTIILDGLDECGSTGGVSRKGLIEALSNLSQTSSGSLRLAVVSRKEFDIEEGLSHFPQISISAKSDDLRLYVAAKIHAIRVKDNNLRSEIIETLAEKADGMYV